MRTASCPKCMKVQDNENNCVCPDCKTLFSPNSYISNTKLQDPTKPIKIQSGCVIGEDGFNFNQDDNGVYEQKQFAGNVLFEGSAWIGALSNIHRGMEDDTIIGDGFICDAQVHIAHDCKFGKNCMVGVGSKILGEVTVGDYGKIWANVTLHQQIKIGNNVMIGAGSYVRPNAENRKKFGVDVLDNSVMYGTPAKLATKFKYPKKSF